MIFGTNRQSGVKRFGGRCRGMSGPYQVAYDRVLPHTHFRWPTRSMWSGWRTAVWTWYAAGSRTKHWDTADEKAIRSIGSEAC